MAFILLWRRKKMKIHKIVLMLSIVIGFSVCGYAENNDSKVSEGKQDTSVKNSSEQVKSTNAYVFTYYIESSAGPLSGRKIMVLVRDNDVVSTLHLQDSSGNGSSLGKITPPSKAESIKEIMNAIHHKKDVNISVTYDEENFPKSMRYLTETLEDGGSYGPAFEFNNYKQVSSNYVLDFENERMNEFERNHKKWKKANMLKYRFNYSEYVDDKKNINNYRDVYYRVSIENGKQKIVQFGYGEIGTHKVGEEKEIESKEYDKGISIDMQHIWDVVEDGLKHSECKFSVMYDERYGYPALITEKCEDGSSKRISIHNLGGR